MSQATELIAQQMAQAANIKKVWGTIIFNVKDLIYAGGAAGNGTTDDTSAVQAAVNDAVSKNATLVFFPPGTYKVTALTNTSTINFVGDNATFVGYVGTITEFGVGVTKLSLLTDVDVSVPPTNDQLLAYNAASSEWKPKTLPPTFVNVMDSAYGAKGDGVADDLAAFNAAIAACPIGGTVFIPTPSVKYLLSATLTISKPIKLMGFNKVYDVDGGLEKAELLEFASGVLTGINVTSYDVVLENFVVKMTNTTASLIAGIHFSGTSMRFVRTTNVFVYLPGQYGTCFKGKNFVIASFEKCNSYQGQYGFYFDTSVNSLKFDSCWARHSYKAGFYLNNASYCAFIATACDSLNNPDYGYQINGCIGVSFVGVGGEFMGKTMFQFDNCDGITVDGSRAYNMNQALTATVTFADLVNGTKNVIFNGCVDTTTGSLPNVKRDATSNHPIANGCDFPIGYSNNGVAIVPLPGMQDGAIIPMIVEFGSFPIAGAAYRGRILVVRGDGTTRADTTYQCLMSATGAYSWKQLLSG